MPNQEKILIKVLQGTSDANILFKDLVKLMKSLVFEERIKGSHHIFSRDGIMEIVNLQSKGKNSKPYQVKQIRNLILKYKLGDLLK
jgi:predicted RNA binding protein YcfA (HicA-like mRNA interferase family)